MFNDEYLKFLIRTANLISSSNLMKCQTIFAKRGWRGILKIKNKVIMTENNLPPLGAKPIIFF